MSAREKIASQPALAEWVERELAPGPDATTDDEIIDYFHKTHNTVYHPACTARMGAPDDPEAVVDPRLRVKGVRGLRIADGSIMPFLPAINPCITTMMIGEKCARDDQGRRPRERAGGGALDVSSTQTKSHSMFVDGEWGPAASGETVETTSPATGEVIGTVPQGDRGDAQRAIDAANRAFEGWSRLTAFERAAKMHAVGDVIEAAATSWRARSRSTRASRCARRPTTRSTSSSSTGAWRPRTPSASAASCRTRSRPASA